MNIQEIIKAWEEAYNPELEKNTISNIDGIKLVSLTGEIADLLALSISDGYNKLAKAILEKEYSGKKVNLKSLNKFLIDQSEEKYSLLHFAAQFGNKEMLFYFIDMGLEITVDKDLMTPLHSISFAKNLSKTDAIDIINKLHSISPNLVNQRDKFNLTPLHYAAYNDNKTILEALINCGAQK